MSAHLNEKKTAIAEWNHWTHTAPAQLQRDDLRKTIKLAEAVLSLDYLEAEERMFVSDCHRKAWMTYHGYAMKT